MTNFLPSTLVPALLLNGISKANVPSHKGTDHTWRDSPRAKRKRSLANRRKAQRKSKAL